MEIIPSILTDNLEDFQNKFTTLQKFSPVIQIDIMDGEFVDNVSFDKNLKDLSNKIFGEINNNTKLELHLMVNHPLEYIEKWKKIKNIFRIIFHAESLDDKNEVIKKIKSLGWQAGIAINPKTAIESITPYLKKADLVLFMTVNPGKQGGKFIPEVKQKNCELKTINNKILTAIDGGVNKNTINEVKKWDIDIIGIGSAIIKQENPRRAYSYFLSMN